MASPQKENGYVEIACEIIEALALSNLPISNKEWKILMFLIRKTYGWHKKEDRISLQQFAEGTNTRRPHACRALQRLIKNSIVTKSGNIYSPSYSFQKDYTKWGMLPKMVTPKNVTKQASKMLPTLVRNVTKNEVPINTTDTTKRKTKERENVTKNGTITLKEEIDNFRSMGKKDDWIKKHFIMRQIPQIEIDKLF